MISIALVISFTWLSIHISEKGLVAKNIFLIQATVNLLKLFEGVWISELIHSSSQKLFFKHLTLFFFHLQG
jgi:hypothetical protein